MGQNTGTLKKSKNVQINAITVLRVTDSQNLNSGNRLMKGLNSSPALVGNAGPPSSSAETETVRCLSCIVDFANKIMIFTVKIHRRVDLRR